jgi:hypothetical protein
LLISFPSWKTLKGIGASYLSTITIAVPLIGYLIFFGNYTNGVYTIDVGVIGKYDVVYGEKFDFIRLKMTYVGLSVVGFATILFRLFCPNEVSSYKDERNYVEDSISTSFTSEVHRKIDAINSWSWRRQFVEGIRDFSDDEVQEFNKSRAAKDISPEGMKLSRSDWLEKNQDLLNEVYSITYKSANASFIAARYATLIGYALGFILILVPSLQIFYSVYVEVKEYVETVLLSQT